MKKKLLASFLALVMVLGLLPTAAFADPGDPDDGGGDDPTPITSVEITLVENDIEVGGTLPDEAKITGAEPDGAAAVLKAEVEWYEGENTDGDPIGDPASEEVAAGTYTAVITVEMDSEKQVDDANPKYVLDGETTFEVDGEDVTESEADFNDGVWTLTVSVTVEDDSGGEEPGGNDPSDGTYQLKVADGITGGSVRFTIDGQVVTSADKDDEVTVEISPAAGYYLDGVAFSAGHDADTAKTDATKTITFNMPASEVIVTPTFRAIEIDSVEFDTTGFETVTVNGEPLDALMLAAGQTAEVTAAVTFKPEEFTTTYEIEFWVDKPLITLAAVQTDDPTEFIVRITAGNTTGTAWFTATLTTPGDEDGVGMLPYIGVTGSSGSTTTDNNNTSSSDDSSSGSSSSSGSGSSSTVGEASTSGGSTTVEMTTSSTTTGSTAKADVKAADMNKAVDSAIAEAAKRDTAPVVEIEVKTSSRADSLNVSLPTASLETLAKTNDSTLVISSDVATVALDHTALSALANQAGSTTVSLQVAPVEGYALNSLQQQVVGSASVVDLSLISGRTAIHDYDSGTITVTLPYELPSGVSARDVVVYYMDDNGALTPCSTSYSGGKVTFTTSHLSKYVIADTELGETAKPISVSPTNDKLEVDGAAKTPAAYKINDYNYFKLRDIAALLNGTSKQFSVDYESSTGEVTMTSGQPYAVTSDDLTSLPAGNRQATASTNVIYINGTRMQLNVYLIDGYNYFKLRDLASALDFSVGWTAERGMFLESDKPYTA